MTLSAAEAKEKCIAMWEHIAENITDKEWRANMGTPKMKAIGELFPDDKYPEAGCFLCATNMACSDCPLGTPHCQTVGQPYWDFLCSMVGDYKEASAAAKRLVEKVRAWEVEA